MRIKLSINLNHPLLLQTPGGRGRWKDATFFLNEEVAECDAWIVYEGLFGTEKTCCPPDQVMLITAEPSDIRVYEKGWLRSFDRVRTVQPGIAHPHRVVGHTALPWYLGPGYDQLASADFPTKTDDISVICSNKAMVGGHRRRLRFVEQLLELSPMPRFGRGFRDLPEKWEGLAPFRYSVAVENSRHDHYWTEKIADCFLAGTVPIYWGAPNINDYFPADAMIVIDTLDPVEVARIIRTEATPEGYQRRLPALREAKRRVLEEYNLFEVAYQMVKAVKSDASAIPVTLSPERRSRPYGWYLRIRRLFS